MSDGEHFGTLRSIVHERARARHMRMGELDRALQDMTPPARADALRYVCEAWQVDEDELETLRFAHACSVALELDVLAQPDVPHAIAVYDAEDYMTLESLRQWLVEDCGEEAFEGAKAHLRWRDPDEGGADMDALTAQLLDANPALAEEATLDEWSELTLRSELGIMPCAMLAEAPSLLSLLQGLRVAGFYFWHPTALEIATADGVADKKHLTGEAARFLEIADPHMRQLALMLWGGLELMGMGRDISESFYCSGVEQWYPGWQTVRFWDAIPHRQEEGYCILRRVAPTR